MDLLETTEMDGQSGEEQAKRAILHTLKQIRENTRVSDQIGFGSQSYQLLTEAASTLFGEPVSKVRKFYANMK